MLQEFDPSTKPLVIDAGTNREEFSNNLITRKRHERAERYYDLMTTGSTAERLFPKLYSGTGKILVA